MLVETDHEHLVLRVAGAGKRQGSGNHFRTLRSHASTVVNNQADRDRDIFVAEILDLLEDSVLVNLKIVFAESRNKNSSAVLHGRVQDDHVNAHVNRVWVTLAALRRRVCLRPSQRLLGDKMKTIAARHRFMEAHNCLARLPAPNNLAARITLLSRRKTPP